MIPILIPDMPCSDALTPWLHQIDNHRVYSNYGPLLLQFQNELRAFLQRDHQKSLSVATMQSGTVAIELALRALNLPAGTQVLVPSFTFAGTVLAIINAGLKPVFVDVDPKQWLLTPNIALSALTKISVGVVLAVAALGFPQDAGAWDSFYLQTGIPVVIDAAGAIADQAIGQYTHVAFSLHATKSISTGEGGVVVSHDETFVKKVQHLAYFGFQEGYVTAIGGNHKLSEYAAAVGLASLRHWPLKQKKMLALREYYYSKLRSIKNIRLQENAQTISSTIFSVGLPNTITATDAIAFFAENHVHTKQWYLPALHLHPAFQAYECIGTMEMTLYLHQQLIGLPFHNFLHRDEVDHVIAMLARAIRY